MKKPIILHNLFSWHDTLIGWPPASHHLAETVRINHNGNNLYLWPFSEHIYVYVFENLCCIPYKYIEIYELKSINFLCPVYCFAHRNAQTTTEPQYCPQKATMWHDSPYYSSIRNLTAWVPFQTLDTAQTYDWLQYDDSFFQRVELVKKLYKIDQFIFCKMLFGDYQVI